MSDFQFQEIFEFGPDETEYRKLSSDHVSTVEVDGRSILKVDEHALTWLANECMRDISHLFRSGHLAQLRAILDDPESSENDRFVALELLKNANIAAAGVLPTSSEARDSFEAASGAMAL